MCILMKVLNFSRSLVKSKVRIVHVSSIPPVPSDNKRKFSTSNSKQAKKLGENWNQRRIREIRNNFLQKIMDEEMAKVLAPLRLAVKEQGDLVRKLKAEEASQNDIKKEVNELNARKKKLEEKEREFLPVDPSFEKARIEDLLKRRFFFVPSFEIYGGYAGLFDLGPMGCKIKLNILNLWRNHFVIEDDLLEVDCTSVTPEPVLKASGHVERFADLMVKDVKTGECFRLDHLIKAFFEDQIKSTKGGDHPNKDEFEKIVAELDNYSKDEMSQILKKYNIKSPITKNDLGEPEEFNLMFDTMIGPSGKVKAYLRPELAQGILVNFKRALEFNHTKLPFGVSQIGQAFRNEISPRSGLLRVREFTLAEIEYFVDPQNKSCEKFVDVQDLKVNLYSACNQMNGKSPALMTLDEAVNTKLINNQTLGYFIGRIHQFLVKIGIDEKKLRFRQHMSNEMAHYASDCWDAELLTSYGWIECVGCADRACFDLTQHTNATNTKLVAQRQFDEPKLVKIVKCLPQKPEIGKRYKKEGQILMDYLLELGEEKVRELDDKLKKDGSVKVNLNGKEYEITKELYEIKEEDVKVHKEDYKPNVIEPSFGIGRIMYCLFEHTFKQREDKLRTYFSLPPEVAPLKCSILPLVHKDEFYPFVKKIKKDLKDLNISTKVDEGKESIGKRYSRTDELSIPFAITIDQETLAQPHSATLRERDSMEQVRVELDELPNIVADLSSGKLRWEELKKQKKLVTANNS